MPKTLLGQFGAEDLSMRCKRWDKLAQREDGAFLVEVCVAAFVLAVAVIGVMGSMTSSLSLVGESKQRSAGSQIAQERLERAHNVPYSRLALYCGCQGATTPAHSSVSTNPDFLISTDGTAYTVGSSTQEPLVVDTTNGAIKHIDDPVLLGSTQFNVYQYVTWHDDPTITGTADYKRVTVVVTWAYPVHGGTSHSITTSTYIGQAGVIVPAATPSSSAVPTASPTPTPTATPSGVVAPGNGCSTLGVGCGATGGPVPTPFPNGTCTGSSTPPVASAPTLQSGTGTQGFTNSTTLQIQVSAAETGNCWPIGIELTNTGASWASGGSLVQPTSGTTQSGTVSWQIGNGDGRKGFYIRFRDANGNCCGGPDNGHTQYWEVDFTLDQTPPTTPANLRSSSPCTLNGSNRTVSLTWDASTDANLVGYRVYRSTNSGAFTSIGIATNPSFSDVTSKGDLIQYKVRAYDKAGNESPDSNVLAFQKQTGSGSTCA